jgi:hypothetical protein
VIDLPNPLRLGRTVNRSSAIVMTRTTRRCPASARDQLGTSASAAADRLGVTKREQRSQTFQEIERMQRTEEDIVVATGAPRERGCPPWVVLGVRAVEARGVRAA